MANKKMCFVCNKEFSASSSEEDICSDCKEEAFEDAKKFCENRVQECETCKSKENLIWTCVGVYCEKCYRFYTVTLPEIQKDTFEPEL